MQARNIDELKHDSKDVVETVIKKIKSDLEEYDQSHFDLAIDIRLCIYRYDEKLDHILKADVPDKSQEWQIKYAMLRGFLFDMLVALKKISYQANVLNHLLSNHLVEISGLDIRLKDDLPLPMQICLRYFTAICQSYPKLFTRQPDDLEEYEQDRFESLMYALRNKLANKEDTLSQYANALLLAVDQEIKHQCDRFDPDKSNQAQPEFARYRKVLQWVNNFIEKPVQGGIEDTRKIKQFEYLDNDVSGQPSFPRKVTAALLGFLGASLCVTSIMLTLGTFGIATPLSAFGIGTGVTLMWKASYILASVMALTETGAAIGLFASGTRKGVSRQIKEYAKALARENVDQYLQHRQN